jgi:hypothetical protein
MQQAAAGCSRHLWMLLLLLRLLLLLLQQMLCRWPR